MDVPYQHVFIHPSHTYIYIPRFFFFIPSFRSVTAINHQVARLVSTVVVVSVVFRNEVCVVDYETVKLLSLQRLHESNIDNHALVEIEPWNLGTSSATYQLNCLMVE